MRLSHPCGSAAVSEEGRHDGDDDHSAVLIEQECA